MSEMAKTTEAARAVERLRLAESRLARRRQTDCGPSETARAAMRFILERADAGDSVTPTMLAEHLEISTAATTGILNSLASGGLISFTRNPDDGRSKLIVPLDRSLDEVEGDPLTARIRTLTEELSEAEAARLVRFLTLVTDAVDLECT